MRKNVWISMLIVGLFALATIFPAVTSANKVIAGDGNSKTFDTSVDFQPASGGGGDNNNDPIIKCKFEVAENASDGIDCDHSTPGTQVDPPLVYNGWVWVGFYVIVTDADSLDEIQQVVVDVWHPAPDVPCTDANPLGDGSLKYDVVLEDVTSDETISFFQSVHEAEAGGNTIIKYFHGETYDQVLNQLNNGEAKIFYAHKKLHYCQPAGYYKVTARVVDIHGGTDEQENYFEYVLGVGIETDFDELDFGEARLNQLKWIHGDWEFGTSDRPTIRSIGNWDVEIRVQFGDMGLGKSEFPDGEDWVVKYDVRLGDVLGDRANRSYYEKYGEYMDPDTEYVVPTDYYRVDSHEVLWMCHTAKISFGILIRKLTESDYGTYTDDTIISVHVPPYTYETMTIP